MYARIGPRTWSLSHLISEGRRDRLLDSLPFTRICKQLVDEARLVDHGREQSCAQPGFYRVWIRMRFHTHAVDLFHNSASGYRAQYYHDPLLGERANTYAVEQLSYVAIAALSDSHKRTCAPEWVPASLEAPGRKVWIHQGLWLRHSSARDRLLRVERWERERIASFGKRAKKAFWSGLVPEEETDIKVLGGFLTMSRRALGEHKRDRAIELHEVGFT